MPRKRWRVRTVGDNMDNTIIFVLSTSDNRVAADSNNRVAADGNNRISAGV